MCCVLIYNTYHHNIIFIYLLLYRIMNGGWLAWECIVFGIFVCASSCAPLWRRRRDVNNAGGSAKQAYIFAGGGVSTLAMILSVARGTLGVRSFLGKWRTFLFRLYRFLLVYINSNLYERTVQTTPKRQTFFINKL